MSKSTRIPAGGNPLKRKAGLLTFPFVAPSRYSISGKECNKQTLVGVGFTATGIVPDFHRIPFSPFVTDVRKGSLCSAKVHKFFINSIPILEIF